jgi:hypothetical protein
MKKHLAKLPLEFRQSLVQYAVAFVLLVILMVAGQRFLIQFTSRFKLAYWQQQQKQLAEQNEAEYKELVAKQAQEEDNDSTATPKEQRALLGSHTLHIVMTRPAGLSASSLNSLVATLKSEKTTSKCDTCHPISSLHYMNTFIQQEAEKYEQAGMKLELEIHPEVYALTDLEQVGDMSNYWGKDSFGMAKLEDAFEAVIADNTIEIGENDLVVFVYFDPALQAAAEAEGFYDHKKFRSYARKNTNRAYVNAYSLSSSFAPHLVEIVTHETLHLFGASDKYEEDAYGCAPEGRGDTEKSPPFPQTTSDIMCGLIAKSAIRYEKADFKEETLVINKHTAQEIGWLPEEDDE